MLACCITTLAGMLVMRERKQVLISFFRSSLWLKFVLIFLPLTL